MVGVADNAAQLPGQHGQQGQQGQDWKRRPVAGALVRAAILAVPVGAALGAGLLISGLLGRPHGVAATIGWYALTLAGSLAALLVVDRLARKLLPLAVLLRLTLVFPDRAPSRLAVALSASSRARLTAALAQVEDPEAATDLQSLVTLAAALNCHDRRTRGHSERVRALADLVGAELKLSAGEVDRLRWAAFLHDIGKLHVPGAVLNKRGPLSKAEWRLIERHPTEGAALAAPLQPWLGDWLDAIEQHHERYDGNGYPHGLRRREISLGARIVAVVDSFETMTAVRSYNRPKKPVEARRELVRCAGTHFDPRVVRGFLGVSLGRLRWRIGVAAWIAELPLIGVPARAGAGLVTAAAGLESTANVLLGAAALALAGVVTPGLGGLTASWAQTHGGGAGGGKSASATATATAGSSGPTAATGPSNTGQPPPNDGANPGGGGGPPPGDPSPAPGGGNAGSPGGGNSHSPGGGVSPSPQPPGSPNFVPPGLGGTPPGLTRLTPGRNGVLPPGQGGTPPGHTGIVP
jgi:putative nucleotidyltransferase with HDIG domain